MHQITSTAPGDAAIRSLLGGSRVVTGRQHLGEGAASAAALRRRSCARTARRRAVVAWVQKRTESREISRLPTLRGSLRGSLRQLRCCACHDRFDDRLRHQPTRQRSDGRRKGKAHFAAAAFDGAHHLPGSDFRRHDEGCGDPALSVSSRRNKPGHRVTMCTPVPRSSIRAPSRNTRPAAFEAEKCALRGIPAWPALLPGIDTRRRARSRCIPAPCPACPAGA